MGDPSRLRALMLCYYFPPKGGAGVQRSAKFVRYLPDFGVDPIVVTGTNRSDGPWEPIDESLLPDVAPEVPVLRPEASAPSPGHSSRRDRWLGRPTAFDRWWSATAFQLGLKAAEEHRPDVVLASMSPFSTWAVAVELGRRLDLPVVADLRDPWGLDEVLTYPSRWHREQVLRSMGRLVEGTRLTVWNTPEALSVARQRFPVPEDDRHTELTNGYDGADFEGPPPPRDQRAFRIVHAGTLHASLAETHGRRGLLARALGGERVATNHWGRTPRYLLEALGRGARKAADGRPVELHLLGSLSAADERLLARFPGVPVVRHGYVPHAETVRAVRGADLLFLPMYGLPHEHRARIVPGKTYEYMAAGPRVLAAVPKGDARDFLQQADAGPCVHPDDVDGLTQALDQALAAPPGLRPTDIPAVRRFERRVLAARLADMLRAGTT